MKESKLTEIIRGIGQAEFRKFGDFLSSPFHNKSKNILQLYELISEKFENFDSNTVSIKKIANNIYPGERNSDQSARSLISNFTKLLEKFFIYNEFEKNPLQMKVTLLKALHSRNIPKSFEMTSKEITLMGNIEFNRNTEFYYNIYDYKGTLAEYTGKDLDINLDKSYYEVSDYLDYLFMVTKLKIINSLLARRFESLSSIKLKFWGTDETLEFIEKNIQKIHKEHPTIYSEYKILMMKLKPQTERHFDDLEKHVFRNIKKYNVEELEEVYYSLTNYCVNKIALGETRFLRHLFAINTNFEKNGFYSNKKNIQYTDFMAVVICGINLKEMKWVEYFVDTYKSNIMLETKRDCINLSNALISHAKRKYKESISYLSKISYKNVYFYLKSKETLIKVFYEQGEFDSILSVIDAAKHYLKRHEDTLYMHYDRYVLFLNLVNRLIKINNKDKFEIKSLINELDLNRNAIAREWLIEKLIELK